ncbi:MAG: hypothetical protein GF417_12545 [Candidatus Latescibacteria bacterium]|nr:hypothetical protein [bacterium]MBD3425258.1 hypothetical protein [Candidatus Latescibacterota bacterium]
MFRRKDNDRDILEQKVLGLCSVMESETRVCRELVDLSESEQQHLMKNKVDQLIDNTEKMKNTVRELKQLQKIRNEFVMDLGSSLELTSSNITLSNIVKCLTPDLSSMLNEVREELIRIGDKLLEANHNTVYLVNFSLDLLEQQSSLWKELATENNDDYGNSDQQDVTCSVAVEEKA